MKPNSSWSARIVSGLVVIGLIVAPCSFGFAQTWQKMPIRSPEMAKSGLIGGEGSQWPRGDLAVSAAAPNFLLLPTDVGGIYRSLDGGATWNIAMNGWNARGANGVAIDPKNASRVLAVAGNSMNWDGNWGASPHGLYLSTDKAASWKQVAARPDGFGGTLAYDATSFDVKIGYCIRVYYLSSGGDLFRSNDGGQSWVGTADAPVTPSINRDWTLGGMFVNIMRVDARSGAVWISGKDGVFTSRDHGGTFEKKRDGATYGLDLAKDGTVFISDAAGVFKSAHNGAGWVKLPDVGLDLMGQFAANIHVSPADSNRLLTWVPGPNFNWKWFVSADGGAKWKETRLDKSLAVLPTNARQGYFAWHPTDPNIAWSIGGDWVSKSTDGGQNFRWSNSGYNGVMLGASFHFSPHSPDTVMLGFQDYNGAFTLDGGSSWNYRDLSGLGWGGHAYGAGESNAQVMWFGDAAGWGNPRRLKVTRDGGATWNFALGPDGQPLEWHGADVSFVDPQNGDVLFASNDRSTNKGVTWTPMADCDGVFTAAGMTLVGKKGDGIVTSIDGGGTWKTVVNVDGGFRDVAYDAAHDRYWVASQNRLKRWQAGAWATVETPRDQYGNQSIDTVALDTQNPDIVYAAGARNTYATAASVVRSTDGGVTWENLTRGDGPHEVQWLRVNPQTRQLWAAGQCYGLWRLDAPTKTGAADPALANAPRAPAVPVLQSYAEVHPPLFALRNGSMDDEKNGAPDSWTQMWTGRGKINAVSDKLIFKSGPASFRLETAAPDSQGQSGQVVDAPAGAHFKVHGWIKSEGELKAQVAVQPLRENWSPISFQQIKFVQSPTDWEEFSGEITLPPETKRFNLVLFIEGSGKAWLDEVKLEDVRGP